MGHSLDGYWKISDTKIIGKYLRIQKFWPKSKKVRPRIWENLRQPIPGKLGPVSAPQQERDPAGGAQTSGTNDSMAIVCLLEAMGFIT